jgi:UDP-N-acetylmuramoylalanine--D-glutamate ligase
MPATRRHDQQVSPAATHKAVVVGLGPTGLSCVRYLASRGYDVTAMDTRTEPPALQTVRREFPKVAVHTGGLDAGLLAQAQLLVVSPGVSVHETPIAAARARGAEIVGDIELFAREAQAPTIAITGSNGKSTVTSLVGAMCREGGLRTEVAGNIGLPVLSLLDQLVPDAYVLELSSFQLETTYSLKARAGAVLNVTPDHMDRYRDLADYAQAKGRIFHNADVAVINQDDPLVAPLVPPGVATVRFTLGAPQSERDYGVQQQAGEPWLARGHACLLPARDVPLPGRHNLANTLAAMALAEAMGVTFDAMRRAIVGFRGLPHRTELVAEHDGVKWINDSKGTNVGATLAALDGMTSPVILIAGGDGKGQDFSPLAPVVAKRARAVVLIGRDAPAIEAALGNVVPMQPARDMAAAVATARRLAHAGDIVLLSPACASFDMFKNYEHRGQVFADAVREQLR